MVEACALLEYSSLPAAGVYAVLGRRRARVLREEMREGSDVFSVHAWLPAEASFGFVNEMRARSSGGASVSLLLSHWERLQVGLYAAAGAASSLDSPQQASGLEWLAV